jgi:hypothetical protein
LFFFGFDLLRRAPLQLAQMTTLHLFGPHGQNASADCLARERALVLAPGSGFTAPPGVTRASHYDALCANAQELATLTWDSSEPFGDAHPDGSQCRRLIAGAPMPVIDDGNALRVDLRGLQQAHSAAHARSNTSRVTSPPLPPP